MLIDFPKLTKDHIDLVARANGVREAIAVLQNNPDREALAVLAGGRYDGLPTGEGSHAEVERALTARRAELRRQYFRDHSATLIEQDVLLKVFVRFQQLTLASNRRAAQKALPDLGGEMRLAAGRAARQSESNIATMEAKRAFTQSSIRAAAAIMMAQGIAPPDSAGESAHGVAFAQACEPHIKPGMSAQARGSFLEQAFFYLGRNFDRTAAQMLDYIGIQMGPFLYHEAAGRSFLRKRVRQALPQSEEALKLAGTAINDAAGWIQGARIGTGLIQKKLFPDAKLN